MSNYDYMAGKKRLDEILDNDLEVIEQNKIPSDSEFTFENGYYGWVSSIFVDMRDSSSLFADEDKEKVSKIVRGFTSEVIEILRDDDNLHEIGIRGDCVYAVYTTPSQDEIYELAYKAFCVNTFMKMLNTTLKDKSFPTIKVGIEMATAQELVVKAGRKGVGINNKVWIGKAVTTASNLSGIGNKNGYKSVVIAELSYINFIDKLVELCGEDSKKWFREHFDFNMGRYYDTSTIISDFNDWIDAGMQT